MLEDGFDPMEEDDRSIGGQSQSIDRISMDEEKIADQIETVKEAK